MMPNTHNKVRQRDVKTSAVSLALHYGPKPRRYVLSV